MAMRLKSPFVAATVGGMLALVGDKAWLVYDVVLKPGNQSLPHWVAYTTIGLLFAIGMAMMAWSILLYRRNGYAMLEIRDELEHRRRAVRRRRFGLMLDRARAIAARTAGAG